MKNTFKTTFLIFFIIANYNMAYGQNIDSTLTDTNQPYAFGKGQLFITPGIGFSKSVMSYGASAEYAITNVVGLSIGFSSGVFDQNWAYYGNPTTIRATAMGLGFKLHTAHQKKRKMFDFCPEINFSKLIKNSDYVSYPKLGVLVALDYRMFVNKTVAFNFNVGKALNGAKKWGVGGGFTFRLLN